MNFSGGLKTARAQLVRGHNYLVDVDGGFVDSQQMPALSCFRAELAITHSVATTDAVPLHQIWHFEAQDGTDRLYFAWGTKVGTESAALVTGLTNGAKYGAAVLGDKAYFFNGTDAPFSINLSNNAVDSSLGVARPTVSAGATVALSKPSVTNATATLSPGGSSNVKGNVKHYICKVTNDKEGALSAAINEAGVECGTGNRIAVALTHADFGSNKYNIYRTKANGTTPYYVGTQTGGGKYTDDIADEKDADGTGGLGAQYKGDVEGEVKGAVKYYISEVTGTNPIQESALSVSFAPIDCGDGNRPVLTFNDTVGSEFYGNTYKIYRTTKDGAHPFFVAQIDVASAAPGTKFTDAVPDHELGDLPFLHGDVPPTEATAAISYLNRLFLLAGSRLYWSDISIDGAHPESFWTAENGNWIEVYGDDGDVGVALARVPDGLLIFKKNHAYKLIGKTPSEFVLSEITFGDSGGRVLGTPSTTSLVAIPGGVAFYYAGAVYIYSGGGIRKISQDVEDHLRPVGDTLFATKVYLGYHADRGQLWLSLDYPVSPAVGTLIYSLDMGMWVGGDLKSYKGMVSGVGYKATGAALDGGVYANDADQNGVFYLLDLTPTLGSVGGNVIPTARALTATTAAFGGGSSLKRFLYADVYWSSIPQGGTGAALGVTPIVDGVSATKVTQSIGVVKPPLFDKMRVRMGYTGRDIAFKFDTTTLHSILKIDIWYQELGTSKDDD